MAILTKQKFASQAQSRSYLTFSSTLKEARSDNRNSKTVSVFLSHSHLDRDMIEAGVTIFKNLPVSVYVDWTDETMPETTNGITAAKIKQKIDDNRKFILLATNNAVISKWCNWELGVGDVKKLNQDHLAIIPLADNNGDWKGNEYLQMYPHIEQSDLHSDKFKVMYPNNHMIYLEEWLAK